MNTHHPIFSVPQNAQAILLSVAQQQARDSAGQNQSNHSFLKTYWNRFRQARADLSDTHEVLNHSSGDKSVMQARIQELLMRYLLQMAQKMTKSLELDTRKQARLEADQAERITRLLEDVEESQSKTIEKNRTDAKRVPSESGVLVLAQALQITGAMQAESEKNAKAANSFGHDNVTNQFLGQKGALEKQWRSFQKIKRIGKVFKIFTQIIMPVTTAVTAAVMGPAFVGMSFLKQLATQGLQALVGGSLSAGTLLAMKPAQNLLSQAQIHEEKLSLSTEQSLQRLSRTQEKMAQTFQREQTVKNNIESIMEDL